MPTQKKKQKPPTRTDHLKWRAGRIVNGNDKTLIFDSNRATLVYLRRLIMWLLDSPESDLPPEEHDELFEYAAEHPMTIGPITIFDYAEFDITIGSTTYIFKPVVEPK